VLSIEEIYAISSFCICIDAVCDLISSANRLLMGTLAIRYIKARFFLNCPTLVGFMMHDVILLRVSAVRRFMFLSQ